MFTLRVTTTIYSNSLKGRRSRGRLVVGFKTTCAISAYQHYICDVESRSLQGVLDSTLFDQVCQWLATARWFSPISSINKTDCHDITEILLKGALTSITNDGYVASVVIIILSLPNSWLITCNKSNMTNVTSDNWIQ